MQIDDTAVPVIWRRHARAQRITLRIDPAQGQVIVTLPARATRAAGLALLNKNAGWVATHLAALPKVAPLQAGGSVAIDGKPHAIRQIAQQRGSPWREHGIIHVPGQPQSLPKLVGKFLRAEAKRQLTLQAGTKSAQAGVAFTRVNVRDTRSRWGSCSATGVLMFSWRLVMAPLFVQDYAVAHEVAHLRHLDHGPSFWALTDFLSPHRLAAVSWLRREGPRLLRVG